MDNISSLNTKSTGSQQALQPADRPTQGTTAASAAVHAQVDRKVDPVRGEALAKELNDALEQIDGNYSVLVDGDTGMVVVRITDTETGELVKQVPPEHVLDISMSVDKIIGLLVNDQA